MFLTYVNGIEKLRQLRLLCLLGEHLFGNQAAITSARILPVDGLGIGEISLILITSPLTVFTNLNRLHKVYTNDNY
jgi:hypothetical protein